MHKVLFATIEAFPLIKTGGLGDVAGSLPPALQSLHCDMRLVMPAYQEILKKAKQIKYITDLALPDSNMTVRLLETRLPGTRVKVWLIDYPPYFDRPGNPYLDITGQPWNDNAERFALFARAIVAITSDRSGLSWQPDLVHCNDWQTGLVPALLSLKANRPATVFTIHNFAYQGLFPKEMMNILRLPWSFWSPDALEYYGELSFIKGGLCFADHITTVSPTYAKEIQRPEQGFNLAGLMRHRKADLTGILNGIDNRIWNPGTDKYLVNRFNWKCISEKQRNKTLLQKQCKLSISPDTPMIAMICRLVEQKGVDLVIKILPALLKKNVQVIVLGNGDPGFELKLTALARKHPDKLYVQIGYTEELAHIIEASADMFLMPSHYEPCGLNQLYSLRYGTVPIVRAVGGLADTVVDTNEETIASGTATGISFTQNNTETLLEAIDRALKLFKDPDIWKQLMSAGMRQDFSWKISAKQYLTLYNDLLPHSEDTTLLCDSGIAAEGSYKQLFAGGSVAK